MLPEQRPPWRLDRVGVRVFAALTAATAAVTAVLLIGDRDGLAISTLVLSVGATAVIAVPRLNSLGATALGCLAMVGASVAAADDMISPRPKSYDDTMLGVGIPSTVGYLSLFTACASAITLGAVVVLSMRRRTAPGGNTIAGVVAAVVVVGGCVPVAVASADSATRALGEDIVDRSTAPDDRPFRIDAQARPSAQRVLWTREAVADRTRFGVVPVPGRDLIVTLESRAGSHEDGGVLRVLDARTGNERWHYGLNSSRAFVSPEHGRVLLTWGDAAIALDLVTGRVIGAIPLPERASGQLWQELFRTQPDPGIIQLRGRTALLRLPMADSAGDERLAVIDMVGLTATVVDRNDQSRCRYTEAEGQRTDHVTAILYGDGCAKPKAVAVDGTRVLSSTPLDLAEPSLRGAWAVDGGFMVVAANIVEERQSVLLFRAGRQTPLMLDKTDRRNTVKAGVLPHGDSAPQRVLLVDSDGSAREFDTESGVRLRQVGTTVSVDTSIQWAVVGDRLYQTSGFGETPQVFVFDVRTMEAVETTLLPCKPQSLAASESVVVVRCVDGPAFFVLD